MLSLVDVAVTAVGIGDVRLQADDERCRRRSG